MKNEGNSDKISFRTVWNIFMAIVYIVLAYLVAFTPYLLPYNFRANDNELDDFQVVRIILGIAMFLYAVFRVYRVLKSRE